MKPAISRNINSFEIPKEFRGDAKATIDPEIESRISAILLTCKPGSNPVRTPIDTPMKQKITISNKSSTKTLSYTF